MNKILLILLGLPASLLWAQSSFQPVQQADQYQVWQDLTAQRDSFLPVEIVVPVQEKDSVEYHMPRIVPGTYSIYNFGRMVRGLRAFTADGDSLPVERLDTNRWLITGARDLYKLSYDVLDTYHRQPSTGIFEPAGTSHLADTVFLLNNFGYIGFLEGQNTRPYRLQVRKPEGFYGASSLQGEHGDSVDTYQLDDYFALHDHPLLYAPPDTAWHRIGDTEILVAVHSPNDEITAQRCRDEIVRVLNAAARYLGGNLPVERYAVLIYTAPLSEMGGSYGALEHHTSTVLYLPEMGSEEIYQGVRDITSHEFFHIITPLRIHSQYVADFDFMDPRMSEHIWLYEGVTEYNSHLVQVRDSIYDIEEFTEVMREKLNNADDYQQHIPLTVASRYTLDHFKSEYLNFYQKGALTAMALDLKLMELSDGEYRLINLLDSLGETYGPNRPFEDDRLFATMAEHSFPEIEPFLLRHVAGTEPFPFREMLASAGFDYREHSVVERITIGAFQLSYNGVTGRLVVHGTEGMNEFGRDLGLEEDDELISLNGDSINLETLSDVFGEFYRNTEVGDKVRMKVARPKGDDEFKTKKLKAKARLTEIERQHVWKPMSEPSEEQLKRRKQWINQ